MPATGARSGLRRWGIVLLAVLVFVACAWWLYRFLGQKTVKQKPAVQQITLIKPPPPPPPPKVEPKPPEPPKPKEEVKLEQPKPDPTPQPKAEQPPPSETLGVDAKGTGPGDGFGIVGTPGGRSITESGGTGGGPVIGGALRADYTMYIGRLQRQIEDALAKNERLRAVPYRVAIRITFHPDGTFRGIALDDSTGDAAADAELRSALASIALATDPGSPRMPREARIRITNRI